MVRMGRHSNDEIPDDVIGADEGPSKSMRKRAATAAQELGERLVGLAETDLAKLDLPDGLLDAIRAARSIRQHSALARQRQYIGRLMRDVDPAPILQLLEGNSRAHALEAARFRRIETWRDRLIAEGAIAFTALSESCQLTGEQHARLVKLLARARRTESSAAQRATAARELFRELRKLL